MASKSLIPVDIFDTVEGISQLESLPGMSQKGLRGTNVLDKTFDIITKSVQDVPSIHAGEEWAYLIRGVGTGAALPCSNVHQNYSLDFFCEK